MPALMWWWIVNSTAGPSPALADQLNCSVSPAVAGSPSPWSTNTCSWLAVDPDVSGWSTTLPDCAMGAAPGVCARTPNAGTRSAAATVSETACRRSERRTRSPRYNHDIEGGDDVRHARTHEVEVESPRAGLAEGLRGVGEVVVAVRTGDRDDLAV